MKTSIVSFISGLLFAAGLGIGGMTVPENIIGFLDFTGQWNPAMMGVMGAAVAVYAIAFPLTLRRERSLLGAPLSLPTRTDIDRRLVMGAALFGIGWGMGGFCPGPGLVSLVTFSPGAWVFTAGLVGGMLIYQRAEAAVTSPLDRLLRRRSPVS